MAEKTQFEKLKVKIPYDEKVFGNEESYKLRLESLLEDALNIALGELYPFLDDYEGVELPKRYYNWQIRACVELYNQESNAGIKSYSENGLSWSKSNDGVLSNSLLSELVPRVGVPKRSESVDN
jgi:hypothetical protein